MANPALNWMPDWMKQQVGPMNTYTPTQPNIPTGPGVPGSAGYMPNPGEFVGPQAPRPINWTMPGSTQPGVMPNPAGVRPRMSPWSAPTPTVTPLNTSALNTAGSVVKQGILKRGLGFLGRTSLPLAVATYGMPKLWAAGTEGKPDYTGTPNDYDYDVPAELTRAGANTPRAYVESLGGETPLTLPSNYDAQKQAWLKADQAEAPIAPIATDPNGFAMVDGNKINYGDTGNPLKDAAYINSGRPSGSGGLIGGMANIVPSTPNLNSNNTNMGTDGQGGLGGIMEAIKSIAPVQDYGSRVTGLNSGNTTWDMGDIAKVRAATAGQRADEARQQVQLGALGHLGAAQMAAEAAKAGHAMSLQGEREKNAYMAPFYKQYGDYHAAKGAALPTHALAEVLKARAEVAEKNPGLRGSMESLKNMIPGTPQYNQQVANIQKIYGVVIPPVNLEG